MACPAEWGLRCAGIKVRPEQTAIFNIYFQGVNHKIELKAEISEQNPSLQESNMTIREKNRSFVLRAVQDVFLEDREIPALKDPWDVRVQIAQTGICGSDVHYWQRGHIGGEPDLIQKSLNIETYSRDSRFRSQVTYCSWPRELWYNC